MQVTYQQLEKYIILQGTVGSEAHGLNLEGSEDRDEMAIVIEPIELHMLLQRPWEELEHRTAAIREGRRDAPSKPGDLDLKLISLQKFCTLAANGNPNYQLLFFTPKLQTWMGHGLQLREMYPSFISKESGPRYSGYMHNQLRRLLGEIGQKRVKRPELEEKYGYDTKYAMHTLRLGYQGIELMETGKLTLPIANETIRRFLLDVRVGKFKFEEIIEAAQALEADLQTAVEKSSLPEHPNRPAIERYLQDTYIRAWWYRQCKYSWDAPMHPDLDPAIYCQCCAKERGTCDHTR